MFREFSKWCRRVRCALGHRTGSILSRGAADPLQCRELERLHSRPHLNYTHAAVKTLVEMPLDDYNALLAKCAVTDREYEILKNGLITPYGDGNDSTRTVVVLCTEPDAKLIDELAHRIDPGVAQRMRQYPAAD